MVDRISREDLVRIYNIEITFFNSLQEAGLVKTVLENEVTYLSYDELPVFEQLANWHYDLEVNLAGLEVLRHLLEKLENLQLENRRLKNQQHLSFGE